MQFLPMTLEPALAMVPMITYFQIPLQDLLEMVLYSKYANKISTRNGTTSTINFQEISPEAILMTIQYLMLIKMLISPSANQHY